MICFFNYHDSSGNTKRIQCLSNLSLPQNRSEGLLKHRWLGPPAARVPVSENLRCGLIICISNQIREAAGLGTPPWQTLILGAPLESVFTTGEGITCHDWYAKDRAHLCQRGEPASSVKRTNWRSLTREQTEPTRTPADLRPREVSNSASLKPRS